jgi:hypothetical protein
LSDSFVVTKRLMDDVVFKVRRFSRAEEDCPSAEWAA